MSQNLSGLAEEFIKSYVSEFKEVLGAILAGSASFGVEDEFADIDIIVYADEKAVKERKAKGKGYIETYEFKGAEICVDWEPIKKLEEAVSSWKDDVALWVLYNAKIIYDPKGMIKELLDRIKPYPKDLSVKKIFLHFYYLEANMGNCEKAILRREPLAAAFLIYKAIDELSYILFILEGLFVPYPKWRFRFMKELNLGRELIPRIEKVLCIREMSVEELAVKLEELNGIVESLKPHLREAGIPEAWLGREWWSQEPDWSV